MPERPPKESTVKRCLALVLAGLVMLTALGLTGSQQPREPGAGEVAIESEERNPWTHLRFPDAHTFHFAVVADRTGGPRAGVFEKAVEQLNRLRPAFVLSVGDLIQGYEEDSEK